MGTYKSFKGSAAPVTLASGVNATAATITANGDVSGWPDGTDSRAFVIELESGTDNEERVLCSLLTSGTPSSFQVLARGWDGTANVSHSAGVEIAHVLDADTVNDLESHAYDPTRDDHTQYLTVGRHDTTARHTFGVGGALGIPGTPIEVGTTLSPGTGTHPAREDHVHVLGTGSVIAGSIASGALNDPAIFGSNLASTAISETAPTSPSEGDHWWWPSKARCYVFTGSKWRYAFGAVIGVAMTSSYNGNIGNGFTFGTIPSWDNSTAPNFDTDSLFGGTVVTIPADQSDGRTFGGDWEIYGECAFNNTAGTFAEQLAVEHKRGATTTDYNLDARNNLVNHASPLAGTMILPLLAGDTVQIRPRQDSAGTITMVPTHRWQMRLKGEW